MERADFNPPSAEELLLELGWLCQLARALVRDAHAAEDLVQDTVAAALEKPPRRDGGRELRPWLAAVARNLAVLRHRSATRRVRRERNAEVREQATPPVELEQAERFRQLAEAIVRLPGPFKEVVILCFYEGLSVREAAKRLELPLDTVRTRRSRAVRALREDFRRRHGFGALLALAGQLPTAAPAGILVASMTSIVAPLALAAVVALAWWAMPASRGEEHAATPSSLDAATSAARKSGSLQPASPAAPLDAARRPLDPVQEAGAELRVRFLEPDGRTPVPGATVWASWDDWFRAGELRMTSTRAVTDAEGRCTLSVAPQVAVFLRSARLEEQPGTAHGWPEDMRETWLAEGESREIELVAREAAIVEGWVWDLEDRLVPGAEVLAWEADPYSGSPPALKTRADARGRFRLEGVGASVLLTARSGELGPQRWVSLRLAPGASESRVPLRIGPVRSLNVVVRDQSGRPVPEAEVRCGRTSMPTPDAVLVREGQDLFFSAHTDAEGAVRIPSLPQLATPLQVRKAGYAPQAVEVDPVSRRLAVTLRGLSKIMGRVLGPSGRPIAGARVTFFVEVRSDPAGRFEVPIPASEPVLPGGHRVKVQAPGYEACLAPLPKEGDPEEFVIRLRPGGALAGALVDDGGAPVIGAILLVERWPWLLEEDPLPDGLFGFQTSRNWIHEVFSFPAWRTDRQGRFRIESLALDRYRLRFYEPRTGRLLALVERRPGGGEGAVEAGEGLAGLLRLEGTVREWGTGKPLAFANAGSVDILFEGSPSPRSDQAGRFQLAGLRSGEQEIRLRRRGYRDAERTLRLSGSGLHRQDFELLPNFAGVVRVLDAGGAPVTSAMIRVHGPQGELLWLRQGNRGMTRLEVAKPEGAEVDDLPRTPATVKVELESGEDFELEVDWSAPPADGQILLALPWMAARG